MAFSDQSLSDAPTSLPAAGGETLFRGLLYPTGRWTPEPGVPHRIVDGIHWLRMPLPFSLDHINLWLLDDGDGWAIVDTGLGVAACQGVWEQLFVTPLMAGRRVTRVIVTHYHPDHIGLAGWLCARFDVPLLIARTEYLYAQYLRLDVREAAPEDVCRFYARAGWSDGALDALRRRGWGHFAKGVAPLPTGYQRLQDGDALTIGGRQWLLRVGRGHAPEHICLICPEAGVMISGDQVLPRITSNVSVYPTEPAGNPLADWFDSLAMLRTLDDDLLVLPAHNEPFRHLHVRVGQLQADHDGKLDRLVEHCRTPRTVLESFEPLFRRPVPAGEMMMATGEALAHLHYLEATGRMTRDTSGAADLFIAR